MMKWRDPSLYLLFTPSICRQNPWWTLREALAGGVDLVQWRVKAPDTGCADLPRCIAIAADVAVPVIVNDAVELAVAAGAAGAHIGQSDLSPEAARTLLGPTRWLGISTHDQTQVRAATAAGADYLGFGPMFPTTTKAYSRGQPTGALTSAMAATDQPIYAIGGIDSNSVTGVIRAGCRRIAVCSAILQADDPRRAATELRRLLEDG